MIEVNAEALALGIVLHLAHDAAVRRGVRKKPGRDRERIVNIECGVLAGKVCFSVQRGCESDVAGHIGDITSGWLGFNGDETSRWGPMLAQAEGLPHPSFLRPSDRLVALAQKRLDLLNALIERSERRLLLARRRWNYRR